MFRNRLSQEIKQTTIHTDTVSPKALMSKKNYLTQSIKKTSKTACANSNSSHTKKTLFSFACASNTKVILNENATTKNSRNE